MAATRVHATLGFLRGAGVAYELRSHDPGNDSTGAARLAGLSAAQVARVELLRDGARYLAVALTASRVVDLGKLQALLRVPAELRLASEQELERDLPALDRRAAAPFGPLLPPVAAIDGELVRRPRILCPAGDPDYWVILDPLELVRITAARVGDICER